MKRLIHLGACALIYLTFCVGDPAHAGSYLPISTATHVGISDGVFRGVVTGLESYVSDSDGHIYTRATIQVSGVFKGQIPASVTLVHRGGTAAGRGEMDDSAPVLRVGDERLFLVARRSDGRLYAVRGEESALLLSSAGASAAESAAGQAALAEVQAITGAGTAPAVGANVKPDRVIIKPHTGTSGGVKPQLSAPFSTATNLLAGTDGIGARFLAPDRGEGIPYLIDADYLPAGISQAQAVAAVQTALDAWTNVTSIRYAFMGVQSFGQAAGNIQNNDGYLRIQLHDHYNYLQTGGSSGDTLGVGGHTWSLSAITNNGLCWTKGGNVLGNDFYQVLNGFLVLEHTNVAMSTLSTFTEVLTHEIGHTIGIAHSSVNPSESNPILNQAIMYYLCHADGRGAAVTNYDINTSRQIHPTTNVPPYNYDRFMYITTEQNSPTPVAVPGINVVQVRGYSLHAPTLTLATNAATLNNGKFSLSGSNVYYNPNGFYGAASLPAGGNSYYDTVCFRFSDGTSSSPYANVFVISYSPDLHGDGIPDAWRSAYGWNTDPSVGTNHRATNDFDGDGYSNLQEYLLGSDPTIKTSNLRTTFFATNNLQFPAKAYEVYEILGSTNLTTWSRAGNPVVPATTNGVATNFMSGLPYQFFRIEKVP